MMPSCASPCNRQSSVWPSRHCVAAWCSGPYSFRTHTMNYSLPIARDCDKQALIDEIREMEFHLASVRERLEGECGHAEGEINHHTLGIRECNALLKSIPVQLPCKRVRTTLVESTHNKRVKTSPHISCYYCHEEFTSSGDLRFHRKDKHPGSLQCSLCRYGIGNSREGCKISGCTKTQTLDANKHV